NIYVSLIINILNMKASIFAKARNHLTTLNTVIDALNKGKSIPPSMVDAAKKDLDVLLKILDRLQNKYE
ncbi:MAG: hypothetical protein KC713_06465, partial [Candidatus Omnitrophica bacterium]|nr:hypothetical protein [Candidatus Omnitrophota bacterium]